MTAPLRLSAHQVPRAVTPAQPFDRTVLLLVATGAWALLLVAGLLLTFS